MTHPLSTLLSRALQSFAAGCAMTDPSLAVWAWDARYGAELIAKLRALLEQRNFDETLPHHPAVNTLWFDVS